MSVSRPESDSPEHLLDWAVHELAAQWDGSTKQVAIVTMGTEPLPSVYWMSRSEAADHTLRYAQNFGKTDPNTKARLQQMATEMLNPASANKLQVSVAGPKSASLGTLDGEGLHDLNQRGASNDAVQRRKRLLNELSQKMYECVVSATAQGKDHTKDVFIIADPTDPRAATVAHVLNSVVSKMVSEEDAFGDAPVVVLSPIPKAKLLFEKVRPKIAAWVDRPAPAGANRIVCMAHGGELLTTATMKVTYARPVQGSGA